MKKILIIGLCIIFIFAPYIYADETEEENINLNELGEVIKEVSANISDEPNITSRAAVVFDRESKTILYDKKMNEKRAMASTTKIMTAIVVLEKTNLSDIVTVSKKAAGTGGSRLGLKTDDIITVHDLLYGLMLVSGNDSRCCISRACRRKCTRFCRINESKNKRIGIRK